MAIKRLVPQARLVTLIGVGGVGKTRLAQRVAGDLRRTFPDGVWLVELAALRDPALIAQVAAAALGLRDRSAAWNVDTLAEHVADRRLLMVLDNCEHLLEASAGLAAALLRTSPGVRVLATSRQPLGLPGEHVVAVAPLSVPAAGQAAAAPADLTRYEAVNLFVERATAAAPGFTLDDHNAEAVARLCSRLEGLPLGIELAAVKMRALTPQQIVERLDERYGLLRTGTAVGEPRQQTLEALFDWSHALCSPDERRLWARVSVFTGGFGLQAAEDVCSGDGLDRDRVAGLLSALVDKSIVARVGEDGDGSRYRLLDMIRDYGRRRLAGSGEEERLRRRHRDHYQRLAERIADQWFTAEEVAAVHRLQAEFPNLRAALDFSADGHGPGQDGPDHAGLRLAASLWFGWRAVGLVREGRRRLDLLLAADRSPTPERARALVAAGWLAGIQEDHASAAAMLEEARALGTRLRDEWVLAHVAQFTGHLAMAEGDVAGAAELLERAQAAHSAAGDRVGLAITLVRRGLVVAELGDIGRACALAEEFQTLAERNSSRRLEAYGRWALSVIMWLAGDPGRADAEARHSIRLHWADDDQLGAAYGLEVLAWIAAEERRAERAAFLLGGLQQLWQRPGTPLAGHAYLAVHHRNCRDGARDALGGAAFDRAFAQGGRCGHDALMAYALEEPRQAAAAPSGPSAPSGPAGAAPELTPREREVARLVAQGMTNKRIAAALVIAPRTAEGHVEHILTKLGFTSRAQIAAWYTEQATASHAPSA
ncbi:LuxR C-terminal-related transcriptional regulator [Actinomadura graeca]|uniref:LuxR C-terminal-related transcriptional regulator n=1 Tax=Actinomadura graeca TaxID=2750812 RepID=UPI002359D074|nr:LuxR C-terminal-related transcriptional regulator [Actinomadura graeca]